VKDLTKPLLHTYTIRIQLDQLAVVLVFESSALHLIHSARVLDDSCKQERLLTLRFHRLDFDAG
jgi:hypothetical protein